MNDSRGYRRAWDAWEQERRHKKISNKTRDRSDHILKISAAVNNWKGSLGPKIKLAEAELFIHWEKIVGSKIAQHSEPSVLQHGRLIIKVNDAIWRHQIFYMRREIQNRLNSHLGKNIVQEIVITG